MSSNRDAARSERPRVQQLRPTNKDVTSSDASTSRSLPAETVSNGASAGQHVAQGASNAGQTTAQSRAGGPRVIPRIVTGQGSGSTIIVNSKQKGNPVLKHITNIGWEYGDIVPDYQVGVATCALFLSLRYHQLHPEYIHDRINKLGNMYTLRILLVHCDTNQPENHIKELTKVGLVNNLTLMVAWSAEEAGGYLERYKMFEHKPPDLIRERVNDDYMSHLTSALTSIRGVNKTDVVTLATNFGSLGSIATATPDELSQCPGFGDIKVNRIREAFTIPFRSGETRTGRERRAERELLYRADTALESARSDQTPAHRSHIFARPTLPPTDASKDVGESVRRSEQNTSTRTTDDRIAQPNPLEGVDLDAEDAIQDADEFDDDILDGLTEEEQLQLAMEMSISGGGGNVE